MFVFIPIIPEMIERMSVDLHIIEGQDPILEGQLNDKINDSYGFVYAISMFVSPLIGSSLFLKYESQTTCDIVAAANLGLAVFCFIFNCGFFVFSENRTFKKALEAL